MERRHFLKLAGGAVIGAAALASTANAAPLSPVLPQPGLALRRGEGLEPAVVTQDDVDHLKPEQIHWRHRWHRRWHGAGVIGTGVTGAGIGLGGGTTGGIAIGAVTIGRAVCFGNTVRYRATILFA